MDEEQRKKPDQVRRAVALRYQPAEKQAPAVSAAGRGWLAERIIALARENKVPVVEDSALARVLGSLVPGEEVPRELYEAVAAIYAFIIEADRRSDGA